MKLHGIEMEVELTEKQQHDLDIRNSIDYSDLLLPEQIKSYTHKGKTYSSLEVEIQVGQKRALALYKSPNGDYFLRQLFHPDDKINPDWVVSDLTGKYIK